MKILNRILTAACAALISASGMATEPNRVIINHADGTTSAYMVDRVNNITFATVQGAVRADINIDDVKVDLNTVYATITGTDDCKGWKHLIAPSSEIAMYDTDVKLASYIDAVAPVVIKEFPTYGNFHIEEGLRPNIEYTFCTLGFDMYGTPCEIATKTFIPEVALTGKPDVNVTITDITETTATVTITPNADCTAFAYYLDAKGKLQEYFGILGGSVGSLEELVETLCYERPTEEKVDRREGLKPATEYELSIVCYDSQGIKSPLKTVTFTTAGGSADGDAWVDITPAGFRIGQMPDPENPTKILLVPFMFFKFTPNEYTARYRQEMFTKTDYENMGKDAAVALVKREPAPDVPDEMWFRYTEKEMCSQFDPNTEIVVIAAGKNSAGEWGEPNILEYTTPAEVE